MKKLLFILLGLAVIATLVFFARREPEQLVASAKVSQGSIAETLSVEGKTRLKQRFRITSPVAGTLRRITLQVGDALQQGQVLAEIEPVTAALLDPRSHTQAQAEIAAAEAAVKAAKQRTAAAKSAKALAEKERQRLQALVKNNAVSRDQYDRAKATQQSGRAEYAAALAEEGVVQARLEAARAQLDDAGKSSPDGALAITSPIDGRLIHRQLQSSQPVNAGQWLMDIGNPRELEIEADILSSDAVRLAPGMQAKVLRWGGKPLTATVRRIEPGGYTKTSALGVEEQRTDVIFDIDSPYEDWQSLGDNYRVDLDITTQAAEDALQIPLGALFRSGYGWAVYRIDAGRARLTPVDIGLKSNSHVQITKGLSAEDTVIIQPDAQIKDGSRIRYNTSKEKH